MVGVLFIGDVFGSPGRDYLKANLPQLMARYEPDFIVVNGENAAGGNGLTPEIAEELFSMGVDAITSGNHIWDKKEIFPSLDSNPRILRPVNYPQGVPGRGVGLFTTRSGSVVGVVSVCGRVFSPQNLDCPFKAVDEALMALRNHTKVVIVDFHAEATSEKIALGWYLDGRVSAVFGTHTHVQTSDERILPGGTGYITDVGMTGSMDGVIGVKREIILKHFLTQLPVRHEPAKGNCHLGAVFCAIDGISGKTIRIERIYLHG